MPVQRLDHVGVIVEDLPAAISFFTALGLELEGDGTVEGEWVDRIVGLRGVQNRFAFLRTPDGNGALELIAFDSPSAEDGNPGAPANTTGLRHLAFGVDDIDLVVARMRARGNELVGEVVQYESSYRLCYLRGPEGIIVELVEKLEGPPRL